MVFSCASSPDPQVPAVQEPVAAPAAEPKTGPEPAKITQEQYVQTFSEVSAVINKLNGIIRAKNMREWESYLTPKFRETTMSPQNLSELNETPLLKRNNIRIVTLKDYFDHVVVPSRANVRLDDLEFTDQNRVQAFMNVGRNESVLIYQLEKINNNWRISIW